LAAPGGGVTEPAPDGRKHERTACVLLQVRFPTQARGELRRLCVIRGSGGGRDFEVLDFCRKAGSL